MLISVSGRTRIHTKIYYSLLLFENSSCMIHMKAGKNSSSTEFMLLSPGHPTFFHASEPA